MFKEDDGGEAIVGFLWGLGGEFATRFVILVFVTLLTLRRMGRQQNYFLLFPTEVEESYDPGSLRYSTWW
ncbi:hypothetical protein TNCV_936011, partial [Trichonephila clavipes]